MTDDLIVLLATDRRAGVFYADKDYARQSWLDGRVRVATSLQDLEGLRYYRAVKIGQFPLTEEHRAMEVQAEVDGTLVQGPTT